MNAQSSRGVLMAAAVCASLVCGAAFAQSLQGADAVKARQSNFKAMGKDFKGINEQLKTDKPDLAAIKIAAADVKAYAAQLPSWFPKGSGPETGLKMQAKAVIWTDGQNFATAAHNFQVEAAKLAALSAASTDVAALRAQVKATGKTCGVCHDKFREKD